MAELARNNGRCFPSLDVKSWPIHESHQLPDLGARDIGARITLWKIRRRSRSFVNPVLFIWRIPKCEMAVDRLSGCFLDPWQDMRIDVHSDGDAGVS